jgi:hypothetical protein
MIAWFAGQPLMLKIVLGVLGSLLLLLLLWLLWLRKYLEWQNVKTLEIEKRVGLKIEFIKTAAQILGGAFFLVTIYVAWQNLVVSQEKHKTDLFTKAIEQLGSEKLEVRLGGIYALERIARDSDKDHGPIMEVLTAYVRLHAPWPPEKPAEAKEQPAAFGKPAPGEKKPEPKPAPEVKPRADIQAILTVLGRRARTYGKGESLPLDLRQTDLRGADLWIAHLEKVNLQETHLDGAKLEEARMEGANLEGAHLEGAYLREAHLEGANLKGARLEGANLLYAHLEGAEFIVSHLEKATLFGAHMEGVRFTGASLEGADLRHAHLEEADLKDAKGLTKKQVASAIIDEKTWLPDYLKKTGPNKPEPK